MNKKENLRNFFKLKEIMNNNFDEFKVKIFKEVSAIPKAEQYLKEHELVITMRSDYNYQISINLNPNIFILFQHVLSFIKDNEDEIEICNALINKMETQFDIATLNQELEELKINNRNIIIMNNFISKIEDSINFLRKEFGKIMKELDNKSVFYRFFHDVDKERKIYKDSMKEIMEYKETYLEPLKYIFDEKFLKDIFKTIAEEYNAINGTSIPLVINI